MTNWLWECALVCFGFALGLVAGGLVQAVP